MNDKKAEGVRARVRAELTMEIKIAARAQLSVNGTAGLSLRAIARDLDMASSAIYRYFTSRDELLTALIVDAYDSVGQAVEDAEAAVERLDHQGRFRAVAVSLRRWAIENPNEYALIYGSPVPGYTAPADTIDPATRVAMALLGVLADVQTSAATKTLPRSEDQPLEAVLADLINHTKSTIAPANLALGVEVWAELFGLISLEVFGHFNNAVSDPEVFFDRAVSAMADRILP